MAALREIADRTEGKSHQSFEVDASFTESLAQRVAEGRKRVSERKSPAPKDWFHEESVT